MRHTLVTATLLSLGFLAPAAAQPLATGPVSGAVVGAARGAASGAAAVGPVGAVVGAPIGAATGAVVGTVGALTAPAVGTPGVVPAVGTRVMTPGLPSLPPGMCYAVTQRGAVRTTKAGRPRTVRC